MNHEPRQENHMTLPPLRICTICGKNAHHSKMVRHSTRAYAHPSCYLDSGRTLDSLPAHEVGKFPINILTQRGLMDEATALLK